MPRDEFAEKLAKITYADVCVGDVVRLHPACDWFMRGIIQAECTSVRKTKKYFRAYWPVLGSPRLRFVLSEHDVVGVVAVGLATLFKLNAKES